MTRQHIVGALAVLGLLLIVGWYGTDGLSHAIAKLDTGTRAYQTGVMQVVGLPGRITGNAKNYCVDITAADVDMTLATTSDYFRICAVGGTAYLTFKEAAPGVTTAAGGFDVVVGDGQCHVLEIEEATVAVIGAAAAGFVCFFPLVSPGGAS